jgi:hypothetical protein
MMDVLNWIPDHPFMTIWLSLAFVGACQGLGQIGTKTYIKEEDE